MRFRRGASSPPAVADVDWASVLRERKRSFSGGIACSIGGVSCCACDDAGGVIGSDVIAGMIGAGARSD